MTETAFRGIKCWEDHRISKVINKEAVSIDKESFLITHTPFQNIRYLRSPTSKKHTDEDALLEELLDRAMHNVHTFAIIQGIPGTGKSHLIRWLKEKYAMRNSTDDVLLIERSNSTLRGVLRQIIESKAFNHAQMQEQLKRVQGAFGRLSDSSLEDGIIDNLRIATNEVQVDESSLTVPPKVRQQLPEWLLDVNVRAWLKRKGGPVERIRRHLAKGSDEKGLQENELPGFYPDDLNLDSDTIGRVQEGYSSVRELTVDLLHRDELRQKVAAYLNTLVDFAIGRSVSLSGEDLKEIFYDLRRNLLKQNKSLALFIEDITAFTGIDSGLVDVLVTQHTGKSNQEFCRIVSVIGITDSYYRDKFPDNLKARMDIHLSLNSADDASAESALLKQKESLLDMVARYMNAIRLDDRDVHEWYANGARLENLPVKCSSCPYRNDCFSAFGAAKVQPDRDGPTVEIGLYPFNGHAISTMYDNLDNRVPKTPRALLNSVIEYVLHNHGGKIPTGEFPPVPRELGGEFQPPPLRKPLQQPLMETQGKAYAKRIESLVSFWGDRTIDSIDLGTGRTVGGLRESIFQAFSLPFIPGQPIGTAPGPGGGGVQPPIHGQGTGRMDGRDETEGGTVHPPINPTPSPESIFSAEFEKYQKDITQWHEGDKLHYYENFAIWIAQFLLENISWSKYDISKYQADKRLSYGRIFIEYQAGLPKKSQIRFPRSPQMRDVLLVLAQIKMLNGSISDLEPGSVGAMISTLSRWLYEWEPKVAAFVQSVSENDPAPFPVTQVVVDNNLLLDILGGYFTSSSVEPSQLYLDMIDVAYKKPDWATAKQDNTKSEKWMRLREKLSPTVVDPCRVDLLSIFHLPQGTARPMVIPGGAVGKSQVVFLDAEKALYTIRQILANFGSSPQWNSREIDDQVWKDEVPVYSVLQPDYLDAIKDQQVAVKTELEKINKYLGSHAPKDVFSAIEDLYKSFQKVNQIFDLPKDDRVDALLLKTLIEQFSKLLLEQRLTLLAVRFSAFSREIRQLMEHRVYLERVHRALKKHASQLDEQLSRAPGGFNTTEQARVYQLYGELEGRIANVAEDLAGGKK